MGLETSVLNQVIEGRKTVEVRLNRGKFRAMTLGRIVCLRQDIWENGEELGTKPDMAKIQVVKAEDFDSFSVVFDKVGLEPILPDVESVEEALKTYYQFYSPQEEAEFGVRAITMRCLAGKKITPEPR
ncbi:MAG TPA: ASCH domain-containing protein [Candidatus Saccharimonadales bacterium]